MMLLALGYSLTKLKVKALAWPLAFSAPRLIGGFAIDWGVALALGVTGASRGVMVIESAMPAAVYNYMFAARFNNRPGGRRRAGRALDPDGGRSLAGLPVDRDVTAAEGRS